MRAPLCACTLLGSVLLVGCGSSIQAQGPTSTGSVLPAVPTTAAQTLGIAPEATSAPASSVVAGAPSATGTDRGASQTPAGGSISGEALDTLSPPTGPSVRLPGGALAYGIGETYHRGDGGTVSCGGSGPLHDPADFSYQLVTTGLPAGEPRLSDFTIGDGAGNDYSGLGSSTVTVQGAKTFVRMDFPTARHGSAPYLYYFPHSARQAVFSC